MLCLLLALVTAFSLGTLTGRSTAAKPDTPSATETSSSTQSAVLSNDLVLLDVTPLCQYPDYPTGCEVITAVMALRYVGEVVTADELIDSCLPKNDAWYRRNGQLHGPDPRLCFAGDPRSRASYGCFAPVIETMLATYFGHPDRVLNTTHTSLDELCAYIDYGVPVLVWATMAMRPVTWKNSWWLPDNTLFTWPGNEHCLLLVGYDTENYYFNDPIEGTQVAYPKRTVEQRYADMGRQSLVITR
ncbi:MAG: C39 family peptidase [Clostridia bacterium]|nr:C39 family peptidase [Clostridia bacterium]